jgi:long-subunit acyl-CoA synthetase (AMP-forming)
MERGSVCRALKARLDDELKEANRQLRSEFNAFRDKHAKLLDRMPLSSGEDVSLLLQALDRLRIETHEWQDRQKDLSKGLPSLLAFRVAMRAFEDDIDDLDGKARKVGLRCPWVLRYSADLDPDIDATDDSSGGRLADPNDTNLISDTCCICGLVIQEGELFGVGAPRVRCLDCTVTVVCPVCHEATQRCLDFLAADPSQSLTIVFKCNPHVGHLCVQETHHSVLSRDDLVRGSIQETYQRAFTLYAARPCFGQFKGKAVEYSTYEQEYSRILLITRALAALARPQDRVAISFAGSRLWYDIEISVLFRRCVSTGIPHMWRTSEWLEVAARASITVVFLSTALFETLCGSDLAVLCCHVPTLRAVVLISEIDCSTQAFAPGTFATDQLAPFLPRVWSFDEFLALSATTRPEQAVLHGSPDDEAIVTFSSGSTGTPKGVISSGKQELEECDISGFIMPRVAASYLPPFWGTDKTIVWGEVFNGGRVAFIDTEFSNVFDALKRINPTYVFMLPVVAQALRAEFQRAFDQEMARARDHIPVESSAHRTASLIMAIQHMNWCLGSRCRSVTIGGAKVSRELLSMFHDYLNCNVFESYGTSESAGISVNGAVDPGVKVRLLDRPDLGYTQADKPFPRGEICVKTQYQVPIERWLCSDAERESLKQRFLSDGFFCTV